MLPKFVALAATLARVAGCALAGGHASTASATEPDAVASPTIPGTLPPAGETSPIPTSSPITQTLGPSSSPAPIDDFDADMASGLTYLVAVWGGSPSDYTLLVSTFATAPSGEKLWSAKFMDERAREEHDVYRNSKGEVGGNELWEEAIDRLATQAPGNWGPPGPDTPYSGAEILNLLNFTPKPFPDALANAKATDLIAGSIWTWDGRKYDTLRLDGTCAKVTCWVDVVSSERPDGFGADEYSFVINLPDVSLKRATRFLGAYPAALDPKLEDVARTIVDPSELRGMTYRGAAWHLPPNFDRYTLTFAADDIETSPGKRVTIDLSTQTLISIEDFTN